MYMLMWLIRRLINSTALKNVANTFTARQTFNLLGALTGATGIAGTSSAMVAGTTTVSTTAVTASSLIFLTTKTPGGTIGQLSVGTITPGVSFVINSVVTDTSTVQWLIIN